MINLYNNKLQFQYLTYLLYKHAILLYNKYINKKDIILYNFYHKKYDKSIKLLKKTTVYLNSLEVCNIIPIYLLYITRCLQKMC